MSSNEYERAITAERLLAVTAVMLSVRASARDVGADEPSVTGIRLQQALAINEQRKYGVTRDIALQWRV